MGLAQSLKRFAKVVAQREAGDPNPAEKNIQALTLDEIAEVMEQRDIPTFRRIRGSLVESRRQVPVESGTAMHLV